KYLPYDCLAGALLSAQREARPCLNSWVLHDVGEPPKHPVVKLLVLLTHILPEVFLEDRPVPGFIGLEAVSLPQVVLVGALPAWREDDATVRPAVRVC